MHIPAPFRRLVVTLLPFAVAAGCIQAAPSAVDDRSPIAMPVVGLAVDRGDLSQVASAAASADPEAQRRLAAAAAGRTADRAAALAAVDAASTAAPAAAAPGKQPADSPAEDAPAEDAAATDGAGDERPAAALEAAPAYTARPDWLGTIPLPNAPNDGSPLPTPPELVDRRLPPPPGGLPAPESAEYAFTISPVPADVLARSTWKPECPVAVDDLRYVTLTHWGFDGRLHTGELVVHRTAAEDVAGAFGRLHEMRFPIEEMRVISMADMNALSTGDGNVSSAFVCRKKVSGRSWSEHSYGLALDINPFHNPYLAGTLVVPGLAGSYLDRSDVRPGMIVAGDEVIRTFAEFGWLWGGDWNSSKDWMHFSANGK
jgi:hypothetical protein